MRRQRVSSRCARSNATILGIVRHHSRQGASAPLWDLRAGIVCSRSRIRAFGILIPRNRPVCVSCGTMPPTPSEGYPLFSFMNAQAQRKSTIAIAKIISVISKMTFPPCDCVKLCNQLHFDCHFASRFPRSVRSVQPMRTRVLSSLQKTRCSYGILVSNGIDCLYKTLFFHAASRSQSGTYGTKPLSNLH